MQNELFKASYEEVQALEDEVGILKQEEAQRILAIREVETQRNRIARIAADTHRKVKSAQDEVAFKHVIVQDLKRTRKEVVRRYNDFQQLYQLVKNQRNKFVSLVAVAGQGIGEFKEKIKILSNEMEVSMLSSACCAALGLGMCYFTIFCQQPHMTFFDNASARACVQCEAWQ